VTIEEAQQLDAADPLAFARERFRLPDGTIYLDGNSLGALPKAAPAALAHTAEAQWGPDLIASWNKHEWIDWPTQVAAKLSPLIGAKPNELLIADSTSVSLFKLLAAAARAGPGRTTILSQRANFPTDLYVAQGLADMLGLTLKTVQPDEIAGAIDGDTAVVTITHVDYRSAAIRDMPAINAAAKAAGALAVWDLSHSAGAIELDLHASGASLAVGCGYKYLNGGPGAPAFIYVAEALQDELTNPLQGWMGHAAPFAFVDDYSPADGILKFLTGTPSILALAALDAGLATFDGIAMRNLAAKSRALSQLFVDEVDARCGGEAQLASPRDPAERGSHVVFAHPEGYAVMQALIARGVVGDFRAPDLMRFGFAPLYNRFSDMVRAAEIMSDILASREWDQPRFRARAKVT
jgi:kynureninase